MRRDSDCGFDIVQIQMDSIKDETSSPPNPHELGQDNESSEHQKLPVASLSNPQHENLVNSVDDVNDTEDTDDNESSEHAKLLVASLSNPQHENLIDSVDDVNDTEDTEDDDDLVDEIRSNGQTKGIVIVGDVEVEDEDSDDEDHDNNIPNGYNSRMIQDGGLDKEEQKKRKLETLLSKYEFAPRAVVTTPPPELKRSRGGRNSLTDWTEHESFILLEAWGERYSRHNRKSVRSDEWLEVADKVSEGSKFKRTETQCRNRLDTLKKKYKKEKAMLAENVGYSSNWVFFSKMDMIICSSSYQANGNGSVNSKVRENRDNSSDEMKDYLIGDSDFPQNEDDDVENLLPNKKMRIYKEGNLVGDSGFVKKVIDNLDDLPPKKKSSGKQRGAEDPFKLLADSIDRFTDMYEKMATYRSEKLVELEKVRMEFQRDLELEKREILKKYQVEMAKICGVDVDENDPSPGLALCFSIL